MRQPVARPRAERARSLTLRSHLYLLVGTIAVPLVVFASLVVFLFHDREDRAIERGLRDTARGFTLAIDREIEKSISTLQALATSDHLDARDFRGVYEVAQRVRAAHPTWPSIMLTDHTGQVIFSLHRPFGERLPSIGEDRDVAEALRTGRAYVSDLTASLVSDRPTVRVHFPVTAPGGAVKYLLSATMAPESFTTALTREDVPARLVVLVLDRTGAAVAGNGAPGSGGGQPGPPDLVERARTQPEGFFASTALDRGARYVAFSRVPSANFTVAVAAPGHAIQSRWFWAVAAGSTLALAVALGFAAVMADRISRPILALATSAQALARGEPPATDTASGVAEVDVVRAAFVEAAREHRERLAADAARREAEADNRAKDQFLAMLSHELRTPLTSMLGYLGMLRDGKVTADNIDRVLDTLDRNTHLQARLVDDLLDLSRIGAGKLELQRTPVDVRASVRDALDACRADADAAQVKIASALPDEPVPVLGDPVRLQQVVGNLLSNAIKFTPDRGAVDVRLDRDGAVARLVVRDTGHGIAADLLPHLFEPFRQGGDASARRRGLGLGLAIVRFLVEQHGGTVRADSPGAGCGATFTVALPLLP
jgi:signal transduction histidine kinase